MTHECMIGEFPYLAMLRASNIEPNNATVMEVRFRDTFTLAPKKSKVNPKHSCCTKAA